MVHFQQNSTQVPERRLYPRHRLDLVVEVWPGDDGVPDAAHNAEVLRPRRAALEDLSLSGLLFLGPRCYPPGTLLWVRLRLGPHTCEVKGAVRRSILCRSAGQNLYGVGLQFVRCPQTTQFVAAAAAFLGQRSSP